MKKGFSVDVYNKSGHKDESGSWVTDGVTYIKTINADIQPYSKELLLKSYGYFIDVNKRIFCDIDKDIQIGTILKHKNSFGILESFEVKIIINWDNRTNTMEIAAYGIQ